MLALLNRIHPYLHLVFRIVLGWIFLQSGWEKLNHLQDFYQDVLNYQVLPDQLAYFYGVCLPWVELLTGVYLVLGLFVRFAAGLSTGMMVSFIIAIGMVLSTGKAVDCGCYVNGESAPITAELLYRDIGLLLLSLYLLIRAKAPWTVDALLEEKTPVAHTEPA